MSKPILHLFWIAEYDDGTALPQFHPDTGEEHLFSEIEQARLIRFGWYAFPPELAQKVENAVVNPLLNAYITDIPTGKELIAYRTTTIAFDPTGQVKHHEAEEYVLGFRNSDLGFVQMHIHKDGRVELRCQH